MLTDLLNVLPTCKRRPDLESGRRTEPKPPPGPPQPHASQRRQSGRTKLWNFLFWIFTSLFSFSRLISSNSWFHSGLYLQNQNLPLQKSNLNLNEKNWNGAHLFHLLIFFNTSVATTLLPSTLDNNHEKNCCKNSFWDYLDLNKGVQLGLWGVVGGFVVQTKRQSLRAHHLDVIFYFLLCYIS